MDSIMRKDITYIYGVSVEKCVEIVKENFFSNEELELVEREVSCLDDFREVYSELLKYRKFEHCISKMHAVTGNESFFYQGCCAVCGTEQPFIVDYRFAEVEDGMKTPNWRERLVCPNCGCNSRQRFIISRVFTSYKPGMKILLYEQNSEVFRKICREIDGVTGFEYPGENVLNSEKSGEMEYAGIFEDICSLSYADEMFDLLVANDVFEHTVNYESAFREALRVLKPGGKLIFTVPFNANSEITEKRAEEGENGLICTAKELFHANPIPEMPPLLVCQIFGWDILETIKECGFKRCCGKVYYGLREGYLGYLPIFFEAYK